MGYPHPDFLLKQLSSRQILEWFAYNELEPFGETRSDLRSGIIASTFANVNRGKDKEPYKPEDFMPDFLKDKTKVGKQSVEDMKRVMLALVADQNKRVDRESGYRRMSPQERRVIRTKASKRKKSNG